MADGYFKEEIQGKAGEYREVKEISFKTTEEMNLFRKYGVGEYILIILGLIFLSSVAKEIITRPWEEFTISIIGVLLVFVSLGSILIIKPFTILEMAKKKLGIK